MNQEDGENKNFQPIPPQDIKDQINVNTMEVAKEEVKEKKEEPIYSENLLPIFGPRPNTNKEYDLDQEVAWLPFQLRLLSTNKRVSIPV